MNYTILILVVCFWQGEYESLAKKLSEYVVKLLDHVRGNDELDIILNEPVEGYGPECQGKLARLKLAIKCNEKQVRNQTVFSYLFILFWQAGKPTRQSIAIT